MVIINDKEYVVNLDIKWGTEKLMNKITQDPTNPNNNKYMTMVFKDLLIPEPTTKEMFNFRRSDIKRILDEFNDEAKETNSDFKKKLSQ